MPIGYVTANQGESRYTVAIPRKTPLLATLIEARRTEIEGIDRVLEELRKHEAERREVYNAAMEAVGVATAGYTECRESYTESACRSARISAANAAYDAARDACFDAWRDCRDGCDLGDGDCYDGCDEAREACEAAAERVRDNALAAVDRLCVDAVVAHLQACQSEHAPIIAAAQAAAIEALAPLQDAMIAITWERTKRTAAVRRLNELLGVQSSAESATAWAAQYNTEIPVGEIPEEPTGTEDNAVIVATVSGRAVITEISSVNPCAHDARALPADVLFVNAALAPGAETWRPTWRTGTVEARNNDGTLKVRIDPAILPGTLGTRVSRRDINCTPPGAFFDGNGELEDRLGEAREAYDNALSDLADIRAEIQACKDGYTVQSCTSPRNEVCEYNREQSMLACIDNRDYCLSIAQDANGVQYCLDQFAVCKQQIEAIYSACIDGATADCIEAKRQHDSRCERDRQFALTQAETAVSSAQRNLLNASADIQGPMENLVRDLPVAHCSAQRYEVGDDVLIHFPQRAGDAMATWNSAQVVGWASNTRTCFTVWRSAEVLPLTETTAVIRVYEGHSDDGSPRPPFFEQEFARNPGPMTGLLFGAKFSDDGRIVAFFEYPRLTLDPETAFAGKAWAVTLPEPTTTYPAYGSGELAVLLDTGGSFSVSVSGEIYNGNGAWSVNDSIVGPVVIGIYFDESNSPDPITVDFSWAHTGSSQFSLKNRVKGIREVARDESGSVTQAMALSVDGVAVVSYSKTANYRIYWDETPGSYINEHAESATFTARSVAFGVVDGVGKVVVDSGSVTFSAPSLFEEEYSSARYDSVITSDLGTSITEGDRQFLGSAQSYPESGAESYFGGGDTPVGVAGQVNFIAAFGWISPPVLFSVTGGVYALTYISPPAVHELFVPHGTYSGYQSPGRLIAPAMRRDDDGALIVARNPLINPIGPYPTWDEREHGGS